MQKSVWQICKEYIGFIGGLVGILWWLGVTPEMVGKTIWDIGYYVLPFVMLFSGIAVGWRLRQWYDKRSETTKEQNEEADISHALSGVDKTGLLLIAELYFEDLRFAEEDLSAVDDPVSKAGIVYTSPISIDGKDVFKISIEPKYRALFTKHEPFFLDEVERLSNYRIKIDRDLRRAGFTLSNGSIVWHKAP